MIKFEPFLLTAMLTAGAAVAQDTAEGLALPDAVLEAPVTAEVLLEPGVAPAVVADLRARFEDLKQRDIRDGVLRGQASAETTQQIESVNAAIVENEGQLRIANWKATNLEGLAAAFASNGGQPLPPGLAAGTQPQIGLALIDAQATLYAQPITDPQLVLRTLSARTTMLRVAETGAFTLVWAPQDGFAFVLSQFRQVF
ncbi:hypothetical protein L0664_13345 [Octadecabacter sp. G9-8]|uniref:Uncharacterized protein n=1 Tax=Octadecabacter dasysiphoniae TaxID=2909341 RepID=A0ABS9D0B7_9RHOB|nr:hypothetical protein [Octadecabacter dasysiphoniae]MCF2872054.1 hypothetical protein [Octadecabacter dasysiphoniae]